MTSNAIERIDAEQVETTRRQAAEAERVIVKAGTNSLTDEASKLDDDKLEKLVDDIEDLLERGKEVLLVSSGAIGAGKGHVDLPTETIENRQAASTVGQSHLMRRYTESFERHDRKTAQILLTQEDLSDPGRFTNFHNTVETLLDWGVVPIINENDAIATAELQIGDNDILSASVAIGIEADALVTLTDVDGVYTANPKVDPGAEPIEAVGRNYDQVHQLVETSSSGGFGGIKTKVEGAREANEHGIPAIIARSTTEDVLEKIAGGEPVGTIFVPVDDDTND
ncbi:glutamate 5-kinase [Halanaeroarchaeum sulfurireducens]|uniref:Glutamate 5-kinase n=1 Tax=Halanaeroarchaeum sulfurireducens TaxID=1604004 RepID=A0A0F7PEW3_9EURY|nr:glutamate 5-kinase [Halanaeroarchaeum sulfurireducens]AKH97868.1 glutamate 5-kinase [Halanaeroarchaeum sulfurireducens]ALG82262.1 glutamate 5-kinase [Halanaeroarchaeum sulfurireducens]